MDAVFALQRAGGDAVFAFQFPVAAVVSPADPPAFGGAWGSFPLSAAVLRRGAEDQRQEREAERAEEIAAAAVARAASIPAEIQARQSLEAAPASLAEVMRAWVAPVTVLNVSLTAIEAPQPIQQTPAPALDDDAILAATALFMRRRRKA